MYLNPRSFEIVVDLAFCPWMWCWRTIQRHVDFVGGIIVEGMWIGDGMKRAGAEIEKRKDEKECRDDERNE